MENPEFRRKLDLATTVALLVAALFAIVHYSQLYFAATEPDRKAMVLPEKPVLISGIEGVRSEATLVMAVFSDFECPFCGRFAEEILPVLRRDFESTGRLRIIHIQSPRDSTTGKMAARAAVCGHRLGRWWPVHARLFALRSSGDFNPDRLNRLASEVGLDENEFSRCLNSLPDKETEGGLTLARDLGIRSLPTVLLGHSTGNDFVSVSASFEGILEAGRLRSVIAKELEAK